MLNLFLDKMKNTEIDVLIQNEKLSITIRKSCKKWNVILIPDSFMNKLIIHKSRELSSATSSFLILTVKPEIIMAFVRETTVYGSRYRFQPEVPVCLSLKATLTINFFQK